MGEPATDGWQNIKVNMAVTGPACVWVVKLKDGKYMRAVTNGGCLAVSRDLCTRFDSPTWAAVMATCFEGAKAKRLVRKSVASAFTYTKASPPPRCNCPGGQHRGFTGCPLNSVSETGGVDHG